MTRGNGRFVAMAALLVAALAGGCSSDPSGGSAEPTTTSGGPTTTLIEPLDVGTGATPAGLGDDVTFYPDVRCGDAERNVVDVAVPVVAAGADTDDGIPLVIHLHGGGFTGGDKGDVWQAGESGPMAELLGQSVAVASMNYSLLEDPDPDGVKKPLMDAARCLQFVRHHAATTFGIDPERIALRGGSAGAGTSLWLAFHDDLADPEAEDPVRRESTKPLAVVAHGTQGTYDLVRWSTDVFGGYPEMFAGQNLVQLAEAFGLSQRLLSFYGITDSALLETPDIVAYRNDVDLLGLMDPADPPAWINNTREQDVAPVSIGVLFHHSDHARALERQAQEVGYDATVTAGHGAQASIGEVEYLLDAFGSAADSKG